MAARLEHPVRSRRNQFRGINPHLHSFWQVNNKWNRFHNAHVTDITRLLQTVLIPLGYIAYMEESLQIRRVGDDIRRPRADVFIIDQDRVRAGMPMYQPTTPALTLTVAEILESVDEEHPYSAISIANQEDQQVVAWIELLSPSNKGTAADASNYLRKRENLLRSGKVFVEIDYLHQTPPTFSALYDYTDFAERNQAHPYRIVILDPRPDFERGPVTLAEFDTDTPIPKLTIPLNFGDAVELDFGMSYHRTYSEMLYGLESVDYRQLPEKWSSYSPADQTRIARRMVAVLRAASAGVMLDSLTEPLPVEELTLEAALEQLQAFA